MAKVRADCEPSFDAACCCKTFVAREELAMVYEACKVADFSLSLRFPVFIWPRACLESTGALNCSSRVGVFSRLTN